MCGTNNALRHCDGDINFDFSVAIAKSAKRREIGGYIHSSVGRRNSVGGTEIESQVTDRQNSKAGTGTGYMGMDKRRGGSGELGWAEAATVSVELAHNNAASSMQNG